MELMLQYSTATSAKSFLALAEGKSHVNFLTKLGSILAPRAPVTLPSLYHSFLFSCLAAAEIVSWL